MTEGEALERFLEHHGIKGMHWGARTAARGSSGTSSVQSRGTSKSSTPIRPRRPSSSMTKEQQLVQRASAQAHNRVVAPALTRYVTRSPGIPKSGNDAVEQLLKRADLQGANRVEREAGKKFLQDSYGITLE